MSGRAAVIGAGAWGTTLAMVLAHRGHEVRLWEYFEEYARVLAATRENPKFLPGVRLPESVRVTPDLQFAVADSPVVVMAVPAQKMRAVARRLAATGHQPRVLITASKGIEQGSLQRMSEVLAAEWPAAGAICALSGPSHAEEVSRRLPCSLVAAATEPGAAVSVQDLFMTDWIRVYTSPDLVGVETGGALKNVIAIAAGVVDGLKLGDNAKAALVTRGLAEIRRLGMALGAHAETFAGLSGMGDLVVTCMSQHSRNRRVGEEIGRGRGLEEILQDLEMVAEGVETARSAQCLAEREGVDLPITREVNRILFEHVRPLDALTVLMQRSRKAETGD